ncbi:MAG: hypothetical protein ACI9K1_002135, partial [Arcticibacterium sp.]
MMNKAIILFSFLFFSASLYAQEGSTTVTGVVMDLETGGVVPFA